MTKKMKQPTLAQKEKLFEHDKGFVIYELNSDSCYISLIELDKNVEHDKGNETLLLKQFIEYIKLNEYVNSFELEAYSKKDAKSTSIEKLIHFYKKFNFVEIDRDEDEEGIRVTMYNIEC